MLQRIILENILFLDIETVPQKASYEHLSEKEKNLWEKKSTYQRKDNFTPEEFYEKAGIWAEFGKIVCISVGYFREPESPNKRSFRIKSFFGDEKHLLESFNDLIKKSFSELKYLFCAHNGKEFDFPYIARRMIINQVPLCDKLNLSGKKPWEVPYLDTLELWKFGDYKNFISLDLLSFVLKIPSPKENMDGSQVSATFYNKKNGIKQIINYCQNDVVATAQIILKLSYLPLLKEKEIFIS